LQLEESNLKRGRLEEEIKESRGGNQVDDKKGKTYTRRSSTGKKEGRKACVLWQRGDTEAQKGYSFCMLLGYGSPNWHVSSSALICRADFNAAELETCQ
jgi:cysteinyl-tRNA synthetase